MKNIFNCFGTGIIGGGVTNDAVRLYDGSNIANKSRLRTERTGGLLAQFGLLSFWIKCNSSVGGGILFNTSTTNSTTKGLQIRGGADGGSLTFSAISSTNSTVMSTTLSGFFGAAWQHVLIEWDGVATIKYVNVSRNGAAPTTYTVTNSETFLLNNILTINGTPDNSASQEAIELYDVWYEPALPDITLLATRQKFINGSNHVDLGNEGQTPLGTQPRLFLSGAQAQWNKNKGSGVLLDTNSGQSGFFNPEAAANFGKASSKPT